MHNHIMRIPKSPVRPYAYTSVRAVIYSKPVPAKSAVEPHDKPFPPTSTTNHSTAMFDLPETKRVRRTKLFKPSPSDTPNAALHLDFDFVTVAPAISTQPAQPPSCEDLDFQLFSTTQKITLKDPTPPPSSEDAWELQAQRQKRPTTYYVLNEADMAARRQELQFAEIVVSAEDIMRGAKISWPGCRVPWKVVTITAAAAPQCRGSGKPGKPGKKRRVYLRKREQKKKEVETARREVEEARLLAIEGRRKFAGLPKEEKEMREREERNKRNREKKVKRRIREKAKKAARAADGEVGESESEGESGDGEMMEE